MDHQLNQINIGIKTFFIVFLFTNTALSLVATLMKLDQIKCACVYIIVVGDYCKFIE